MVVRLAAPSAFVRRFEYADGTPNERRVDEMERWPVERADLVTAPSGMIADFAAASWAFDRAAVAVIPNGVDTAAFALAEAAVHDRAGRAPLVLCVNRITPLKGPETFVRAAAIVHQAFPQARFRMVGRIDRWDGIPGDVRLRDLAAELGLPADRLELAGEADHDALPAEYAAADVCVNPSLGESFSLTSAEALASGRACVLSRAMGIVETIAEGEHALVVPTGDAEAFAAAITTLLGDGALRGKLGAAARSLAQARFSSDVTAGETETAYRKAVARVRGREPLPRTRLNVAILTHNALDYTKRCLESIARHTTIPYHVFVLDNASTDGTREWLSAQTDGRVHVTLGERNLGVPGGRNALIRTILPYLRDDAVMVFLDNDVEVLEGWWEPAFRVFDARPRAGIAGETGHPIVVRQDSRELLPTPAPAPADVDLVCGFCVFARAACAREVGLFDEKLGLFWHEDDDWCVRASLHGWGVVALASRRVIHHEHKSGAALPAIRTGGSPANQRYLAAKWRSLGLVDETGRIATPAATATLELRTRLGAALGRGEPVPQDELERAAQDLASLLRAADVVAHLEARTADLSPTLAALLAINVDQARSAGNEPLRSALEEIAALVRECRYSALLRQHLAVPPAPSRPARGGRRLSKLCDASDWDLPEWRSVCAEVYGDAGSRNWYTRHRKAWESVQVAVALRQLLPDRRSAQGLIVNAGVEPLTFGLSNEIRSLTAADVWGEAPEAPADMLDHPERFAAVPFARNRLLVVKMDPASLGFPDESFDFVVACSLHRFPSETAAARALSECSRVVKPGGVVIAVTEVGLNAVARPGLFVPDQLVRLATASGLEPVEDMDFSLADATLDGFVDLAAGPDRRPHLVLAHGDLLFTSGILVLEKAAGAAAEMPG
jgi:GT2 family glycosyltransferase/SAM-dependent methyltransferase